jgi:hypothetical protein
MASNLCDFVEEYLVPRGIIGIRIEANSSGSGTQSATSVTLQIQPGATLRLRLVCLPEPGSPDHDG